jgi:hypothetical protein
LNVAVHVTGNLLEGRLLPLDWDAVGGGVAGIAAGATAGITAGITIGGIGVGGSGVGAIGVVGRAGHLRGELAILILTNAIQKDYY